MRSQTRVVTTGHDGGGTPLDLVRALEANDRFRRDTGLGGIFHPGKISYREISPTNSLHIVIDRDLVSAHVARISPLILRRDGSRSTGSTRPSSR